MQVLFCTLPLPLRKPFACVCECVIVCIACFPDVHACTGQMWVNGEYQLARFFGYLPGTSAAHLSSHGPDTNGRSQTMEQRNMQMPNRRSFRASASALWLVRPSYRSENTIYEVNVSNFVGHNYAHDHTRVERTNRGRLLQRQRHPFNINPFSTPPTHPPNTFGVRRSLRYVLMSSDPRARGGGRPLCEPSTMLSIFAASVRRPPVGKLNLKVQTDILHIDRDACVLGGVVAPHFLAHNDYANARSHAHTRVRIRYLSHALGCISVIYARRCIVVCAPVACVCIRDRNSAVGGRTSRSIITTMLGQHTIRCVRVFVPKIDTRRRTSPHLIRTFILMCSPAWPPRVVRNGASVRLPPSDPHTQTHTPKQTVYKTLLSTRCIRCDLHTQYNFHSSPTAGWNGCACGVQYPYFLPHRPHTPSHQAQPPAKKQRQRTRICDVGCELWALLWTGAWRRGCLDDQVSARRECGNNFTASPGLPPLARNSGNRAGRKSVGVFSVRGSLMRRSISERCQPNRVSDLSGACDRSQRSRSAVDYLSNQRTIGWLDGVNVCVCVCVRPSTANTNTSHLNEGDKRKCHHS